MSTIEHNAAEWVARHFARGLDAAEGSALQAWLAAEIGRAHF